MPDPVTIESRLPPSPHGSACSGHAPFYEPDSIAIWQSSPAQPASPPQNYYDFDVEELSENHADYPHHAQVLHPYELEEIDTPIAHRSVNRSMEIAEEDVGQNTHESDSTALACRLRRIRWNPVSRPSTSPRLSPVPSNPRKRMLSEALDTDSDSDGFSSPYTRSEPPRVRRRIREPAIASAMIIPSTVSDVSTPHATTTALTSDELMDVDEQAA
ncbi:hypothetical protein E4T44_10982 [Aureobasidium sp. EXF-8845]|nr:hypothetical protein E4T44_10982 [Aureobasidium sp. EXF-8845]KAI4819828.1 hypothetical protein E4T45_10519 [Aureobasidium sp. EXF-8846]